MSKNVSLGRDELTEIKNFVDKYPDAPYITIEVDSSSGIGSIVKVSLPTVVNGDHVIITKIITDESSW